MMQYDPSQTHIAKSTWICPACGAGNAAWNGTCGNCTKPVEQIRYTNVTGQPWPQPRVMNAPFVKTMPDGVVQVYPPVSDQAGL